MRISLFLLFALFVFRSEAQTRYEVSSGQEFIDAQNSAKAGDSIVWLEGIYRNTRMEIIKDGITVTAQPHGSAIFTGVSRVIIYANQVTFSGIQYVGGDIGTLHIMQIFGSDVNIAHINMQNYTCHKYLIVDESSRRTTISHCNFEKRLNRADQNILSILVDNEPGFHKIQYCSFKNFEGIGQDQGVEPIRIGVSSQKLLESRTLVEYCYFTKCNGDGEIISHKARQNVYRYNTFEDNPVAELVLRHGDEGIVYGNFFLNNMGGIRVREGSNHFIYNNYFQGLDRRSIFLQNESSDPLTDIHIYHNTILDSEATRLGGSGSNPPTNVTIANNIFANPKSQLFNEDTGDVRWRNNIAFGTLGIDLPSSGIVDIDPSLIENTSGYFQLDNDSPALQSASANYPAIPLFEGMDYDNELMLDLMQQRRPSEVENRALGSTELSDTVLVKPFATESNTGPDYLDQNVINYILVNETQLNYDEGSSRKAAFISSNVDWTIERDVDWISVDIISGSNDQRILISVESNPTASQRTGEVFVTDGMDTARVEIVQDAGGPLSSGDVLLEEVILFPNPTDGDLTIKNIPLKYKSINVEILDSNGTFISRFESTVTNSELHVRLPKLLPKVYMLKLNYKDGQGVIRARQLQSIKVI